MAVKNNDFDAVVIGTGLGGLATTLRLLNYNKKVIVLDKSPKHGGNSIMASSGINGVPTKFQPVIGDSVELFIEDTLRSGGGLTNESLAKLLAKNSKNAINWLVDELGLDLSIVSQLGGHSMPRTHRGPGGPPGYEIITSLFNDIKNHPNVTVLMNSRLTKIIMTEETDINWPSVSGIEYQDVNSGEINFLKSRNLVLATGGYSADIYSSTSLIRKYRPELIKFPSTNGDATTGDGQKIAERDCDAKLIDMKEVQIHPTGFVKFTPGEMDKGKKILCGELIRGIGGILLSPLTGKRFVNELQTRDVLSSSILKNCHTKDIFHSEGQTAFSVIAVSNEDYHKAMSHVNFYMKMGLMFKGNVEDLHKLMTQINPNLSITSLRQALVEYNDAMENGDNWGRTQFGSKFEESEFYFGIITPVLHYTMGGIQIDHHSNVVRTDNHVISNLYAVGEVGGGLHGRNRLSGSSLLQCVVFGTLVAEHISELKGQ
ncbi:fumarate reductase 1 [[Candida] jaroonii]|uniref:Fumarate reductase 1 n=1 Tax=[Candida] jaroonii TaxID=467808 RepID=A0ACA9YDR8_9ASCO|nr:fumarate reductase 1 [[Candida] jaroonii]